MTGKSAIALARDVDRGLAILRTEHDNFRKEFERTQVSQLRERLAVMEESLARFEKLLDELKHVLVLEDRVNKLEKHHEEAGKRSWQFVFIAVGAGCAVVGGVAVQLITYLLKK